MEKEDIAAAFSSSCCARDCISNVTPNFIRQFRTHFSILNEKQKTTEIRKILIACEASKKSESTTTISNYKFES